MKKEIGENVFIPVGSVTVEGYLELPEKADSIVIFSHSSGSSRFSPRNKYVADVVNNNGMATLLVDLLTPKEDLGYSASVRYCFTYTTVDRRYKMDIGATGIQKFLVRIFWRQYRRRISFGSGVNAAK